MVECRPIDGLRVVWTEMIYNKSSPTRPNIFARPMVRNSTSLLFFIALDILWGCLMRWASLIRFDVRSNPFNHVKIHV